MTTSTATINKDKTINVTLVFTDDAVCLQDCDQLIEYVGKGKDSTGLLITLAEEIAKAVGMPDDYVEKHLAHYS